MEDICRKTIRYRAEFDEREIVIELIDMNGVKVDHLVESNHLKSEIKPCPSESRFA